jgi:hypothetical protein
MAGYRETTVRPLILDMLFHDDRMFVLEISPIESRDGTSVVLNLSGDTSRTSQPTEWAVVTRRNVPGYPPHRVDHFPTRAEAVAFYKRIVVQTPRKSLGEKSPDPIPALEAYSAWLQKEDLFDPILNPTASQRTDA